jgi:phage terminase small subunit
LNAVLDATQKVVARQQQAATLDETTLKTAQTRADQYRGRIQAIIDADPSQQDSLWAAEIAKERQAGTPPPANITDKYPGDDTATYLANHFALGSTLAKEAIDAKQATARQTSANAAQGELTLNQQKFAQSPEELARRSAAVGADGQPTPDALQAKSILDAQSKQATTAAGAKAGAEAAAKFPWEARLEQMRQQGDPVFAYDPKNKQTVQVSRAEAQQGGFTNIVKVGQPEIDKAKTSAMKLGDATMNIAAYKIASQKMDELSGSDIATVSRVLGSDQFKAHFLGMELPVDWANELYKSKGWTDMPESAKDAVVNYIAARPAAISLLRAINPGVRLTESQIATELKNIPDPTTPSDIRERQFQRLDCNIDQASKTLVRIPGVDLPSDIRDRLQEQATQAQSAAAANASRNAAANAAGEKTKKRHEIFAREYAVDLNGKRAAIAAGYSAKGAEVRASEMLAEPEVTEMIDTLLSERASRLDIKGSRILEMLHAIATFDARDFYRPDGSLKEVHELSYETQLGLAGFEVDHIPGGKGVVSKIKLARPGERAAAAAILAKFLPDLKENAQNIDMIMRGELAALSEEELQKRLKERLGKIGSEKVKELLGDAKP